MKNSSRRSTSFRSSTTTTTCDSATVPSSSPFWLFLHVICCLFSLLLGFRFSRLLFFLLFSPSSNYHPALLTSSISENDDAASLQNLTNLTSAVGHHSHVVVGRHGILIRPNPHPDPVETMKAHMIMERVQKEQRLQYGVKDPRGVIVITPTYVRTFQAMHLTGLMHGLMLVKSELTWIVVEAGGVTNETRNLIEKSGLKNIVHLGFEKEMPNKWIDRHRVEALMRMEGLRVVRERKLDGIVVFADDSNMHSLELFDEIQKVKWIGALSVGILAHSADSDPLAQTDKNEEKENMPLPIQGPACNSSNQLVGWHTFNSLPYKGKSATFVGEFGTVLPTNMEWASFVINSRLVWKEADNKPEWVRDFDSIGGNGEEIESPLGLLKDPAFVEPLGNCGKKVMLWWLRVEARSDSKFPSGWIIDPPLDITVPAKRTPWPDAPPELPSEKLTTTSQDTHVNIEKRASKTRRSRHSSRGKKKHEHGGVTSQVDESYQMQAN